jgi:benzoyl-CoA reductase/2-hydroxyglutaryl-CoA dehydratase subunit BcrC/BadD/HgdB
MNPIAYCSPFVPPEWIAAYGLRPKWLRLRKSANTAVGAHRGVCPVAGTLADTINMMESTAAVVLTTTCDQIRYVAALLEHEGKLPVFLMHVPRTWQHEASRTLYREELLRLGHFLVEYGGKAPTTETLQQVMLQYDQARMELHCKRNRLSVHEFVEAVINLRGELTQMGTVPIFAQRKWDCPLAKTGTVPNGKIPLALVGGPMLEGDDELLQLIERAGGRIALEATEAGERTLPAPFVPELLETDPIEELVRAYFDAIPDVFRRPNDRLYEWLGRQIVQRGVRGLIVRRYLWCDLWHAELARLRQECSVPVLDWDAIGEDHSTRASTISRLEAFLEMLR